MQLRFLGAAQEVTGSCCLVEADGLRFLVDCGMFQGGALAREHNQQAWPFDPRQIDFVLVTHAHIDHSGLLPRLAAFGFKGPIYTTTATADLLKVMLLDSAFIQEMEWARAERRHRQPGPHGRAVFGPLYTVAQAQACLGQLRGVAYDHDLQPHPQVRCRFRDAGHILGSAIVELWLSEGDRSTKLVFSGDLGQPGRPIVRNPTPIDAADVLLVESTYGNRLHRPLSDTEDELVEVITTTLQRRHGNVLIPAFALGRTQELLFVLARLCQHKRLPRLKVFVDSPLAAKATAITWQHPEFLDDETRRLMALHQRHPEWMDLRFTESVEESEALNRVHSGAIIIAASGMCDAGRIKHHLRHNLERRDCAVVLIGYQAGGTLGRRLVDGEKEVRIFGEPCRVRASIHTLGGLSAHADQAALMGWLGHFKAPPGHTFVVHGEAETARGFADKIRTELGWQAEAPAAGQRVTL